jgi:hypothetical protein
MGDNGGQKIQMAVWYTGSEGMYWIHRAHNNIQFLFLRNPLVT